MDGLVHGRRRQLRKEREARATRRRDLDQKHRDSTQLRKQRIDKLKALENDQGPLLLAPDGAAKEGTSSLEAETTDSFRHCYTCKKRFDGLHEFYSQLCPACAALNWRMRSRTEDLTGRVALLTGARVKIGFETGLKLLRAGAYLIATTRFPHDLAARYGTLAAFFCVFAPASGTHASAQGGRPTRTSGAVVWRCTAWTCGICGASRRSARLSRRGTRPWTSW